MSVVYGIIIGLALGLTGGGGSIFAVPMLIYGLDVLPQEAVAISLLVVAVTSAVGAVEGGFRGLIEWRAAAIFSAGGVLFAPVGVWLGNQVPDGVIVSTFACLMLVVAFRMLRKALRAESSDNRGTSATTGPVCHYDRDGVLRFDTPCGSALSAAGIAVGVLSGFFGVGGGFLIVPALLLVTGMSIHRAVASSLLIITLVGLSGVFSAVLSGRQITWVITGLFILGGAAGMVAGRVLAGYLAGRTLQVLFAVAMLGIAVFMLVTHFGPS